MIRAALPLARATALLLALIAIGFKGMLPVGYMVAAAEHGPALILCTSQGAQPVDSDGEAPAPAKDQVCAFAAAPASAETPVAPSLAAPMPAALDVTAGPPPARGIIFITGPPLPARGPPAIA